MNVKRTYKSVVVYELELSELEFNALYKLIGNTSFDVRRKYGLDKSKNDAVFGLYNDMNAVVNGKK